MSTIDWLVVALFIPVIVLPAFFFDKPVKEAGASERFAAGRSLGWLVLGGSLAATSLSPDTPLLISGAFYKGGLAENWFWLAGIPGALATLIFFARYWRRTNVLTEPEIITVRYGHRPATKFLRVCMAVLDAGLINILVLASVIFATHILISQFFGLSDKIWIGSFDVGLSLADAITIVFLAITVIYTFISGFRVVVKTDFIQLIVAIFASIVVAGFALCAGIEEFGSYRGLVEQLPSNHAGFELLQIEDFSVLLILLFRWWQIAPGGGLFVQRLVSAKSEDDAALTALSYTIIHYALRAWPWFLIGAVALIYAPSLTEPEHAFPAVAERFLPAGGLGLLIVAFWAAFMSTVDSRLNWGASYFVNDVYSALGGDQGGATARKVEGLAIAALALSALVIALSGVFSSIIGIYKYLILIQAGSALVAITRWYWWRSTIEAEFAALIVSFALGNALYLTIDVSQNTGFATALAVNSVLTGMATIAISFLTSREGPTEAAQRFNDLVQVAGPGWKSAQLRRSEKAQPVSLQRQVAVWLVANAMIYAFLALVAWIVVLKFSNAALAGAVMLGCIVWLLRNRQEFRDLLRS